MVHNWIYNGQQQDLFAKQTHFTHCPAECGKIEYHQHYMACYAPPMIIQNNNCMIKLIKTWKGFKTAIPIFRALTYIITCVISETEPLQCKYSVLAPSFDTMVFQAWKRTKSNQMGQKKSKGESVKNGRRSKASTIHLT